MRYILIILSTMWAASSFASEPQNFKLAVISDSFSTGAWTKPNASLDPAQFDQMFLSSDPLAYRFQLRMPQDVEYSNSFFWVAKNMLVATTQKFLDNPDASWVAHFATKNQFNPSEVLNLSRDAASVSDAYSQTKSLLMLTGGKAPLKTIYFFSLMDTCAPSSAMFTAPDIYEKYWEDTLRYYARQGEFGTDAVVELWAPLNVTQVVTNPDILSSSLSLKGNSGPKTCKELAQQKFEGYSDNLFGSAMYVLHPAMYCSGLMRAASAPRPAEDQDLLAIANHLRLYRQKLASVAKKLNKELKRDLFVVKETTADFAFKPEYLGPDCLHLNAAGHQAFSELIAN